MVFIKAVIDGRRVGVWRVGVDALTLSVVEVQLLIVIFRRNNCCFSYGSAFLRVELLQSLPVVVLHEADIVDVVQEVWILLYALVESLEGVVQIGPFHDTSEN